MGLSRSSPKGIGGCSIAEAAAKAELSAGSMNGSLSFSTLQELLPAHRDLGSADRVL